MLVIQHIETAWLKNERGAQHGTLRGKTPTAVSLPAGARATNQTDVLLHHIRYARASSTAEEQITVSATAPHKVGCVVVTPTQAGANIRYEWSPYCGGSPVRSQPYGPWKTRLGLGQWCRVRYNGRIVTETTEDCSGSTLRGMRFRSRK